MGGWIGRVSRTLYAAARSLPALMMGGQISLILTDCGARTGEVTLRLVEVAELDWVQFGAALEGGICDRLPLTICKNLSCLEAYRAAYRLLSLGAHTEFREGANATHPPVLKEQLAKTVAAFRPPQVLRRVRLTAAHHFQGATKHFTVGEAAGPALPDSEVPETFRGTLDLLRRQSGDPSLALHAVPKPAVLEIVSFDSGGYNTLWLDEEGVELDDTWDPNLEDALQFAEAEFGVRPDEWEIISSGDL